jgi:hypothetical protein
MTEENPLPVPLCPPKMSNGLDTDGTLVSPMRAGEQPSLCLCLLSPTAELTEDTLKSIDTYYVAFLQGSGLCEPGMTTSMSDTLHAYNPRRSIRSCNIMIRPWLGRQRNRGSIPRRGKRFVFSPKRTDKLRGPTIS